MLFVEMCCGRLGRSFNAKVRQDILIFWAPKKTACDCALGQGVILGTCLVEVNDILPQIPRSSCFSRLAPG